MKVAELSKWLYCQDPEAEVEYNEYSDREGLVWKRLTWVDIRTAKYSTNITGGDSK